MSKNVSGPPTQCWQLNRNRATLNAGGFTGLVDVERPGRGLHELCLAGSPFNWQLLRIGVATQADAGNPFDAAWHPSDAYVRGCDLVATYCEPLGQPFNVQIYWRAADQASTGRLVVETIISVQTPSWEAYPGVGIDSQLPDGDLLLTNDNIHIYDADARWSYVELPFPDDFTLTSENPHGDGLSQFRWRFGPVFMERGVIRRLRLRGAILPRGEALQAVDSLWADFLAEQPPLTT
jgi:hypothetical protein